MEQLRTVLRVVAFAAFAAVFYVVLLAILPLQKARNLNVPTGGYGHQWTRSREALTWGAVDVLFVGSSHAYRGFDPRIWSARGYRTFNLGSSGQTPLQSEVLLTRHLTHLDPKLVVLVLDPLSLGSDGVESALDILANAPVDAAAWRMAWHIGHLKVWNGLLYNWAHRGVWGMPGFDEPVVRNQDTYVPGGYVEKRLRSNTWKGGKRARTGPIRPEQLQALDRIIEMLHRRGTRTIVVETPVTLPFRESYPDHADLAARMARRAPYYDLQHLVPLDDTMHFYDAHHLNQLGVQRMNMAFIDRLIGDGVLVARP
jgi:hypothetical protein